MTIIFLLALIQGKSQTPTWQWARCPSGYGQGEGWSLAVDDIGNSYLTGTFGDTLIYGSDTVIDFHGATVFTARYDANGNAIWARCSKGSGNSYGQGIATDDSGNVYVTGYYSANPSIQFGSDTLTTNGIYHDIYVVKYDSSGNQIWVKSYGGTADDETYGMTTDNSGNIFITGYFNSPTINFDSFILTNSGSADIFIVKLNSSGNVLWAKSGIGSGAEISLSIATDATGNAYICGQFQSPQLIFGNDTLLHSGLADIFLAKYSSAGNNVWAKRAGGTLNDLALSVATNPFGKVFITGYFDSTSIAFSPYLLNPSARYNTFIVQYDSSGIVDWAKSSSAGKCAGRWVTTDNCGNIMIAGSMFSTPVAFDSINLVSSPINGDNMFLVQFCPTGEAIWGTTLLFGGDDQMVIAADANHNIYLGGDFEPTPVNIGTDTMTHPLGEMPFVAKLNYSCVVSCDVGISDIANSSNYILFPNPFTNSVSVKVNDNEQSQFILYDILSRKLLQESFTNSTTINTEQLADGIYIYEVLNKKGTIANGKLIKQ